ncbi:hypothetical protein J8M21_21810 [Pseudoalteromonas luteoviolacea]|uniref:hypothetical protein n=1 Tax=Pseudoalteromonas luteoviolacea TaxID=43657 RepID=UPI001B3A5E9F|nr:hypothetical protein [Pseudoalteromonas luteoviolacea]MBQ4879859.1 hypothetical protein [Pseudoalteromonas luteoviolacea]MBQ4908621.1 hypothetical protein [Pseudoalteromonas luteoviolacea]
MKTFNYAYVLLSLIILSFSANLLANSGGENSNTQVVTEPVLTEYKHQGVTYPPVLFVTNIEDSNFTDSLDGYEAFSKLDKEAVGLPIGLRVLKLHRTKQDATQFSSLMLSASTLGIIPIVSNTEFKVRYDIFVQGKSIAHFEYSMDSTDVGNMWTQAYNKRETKPSEVQFLADTIPAFLNELSNSKEVKLAFAEYEEYFGDL